MTETKNITTSAVEIYASATRDLLVLQNDSDTDFFYDLGVAGDALTTANGVRLESGERLTLRQPESNLAVRMIHGSTGNKTLRVVRN